MVRRRNLKSSKRLQLGQGVFRQFVNLPPHRQLEISPTID
jgi:hypothetical protein